MDNRIKLHEFSSMKRIYILLTVALVLAIVIGSVLWFRQEEENVGKSDTPRITKNSETNNKSNVVLSPGKEEKIFSIQEALEEGCSDCEFNPNQFWEFVVSPDFSRYAYEYWTSLYDGGKSYVVLDGKKQKEYDEVHDLRFDAMGKNFTYHAYDKKKDESYLVYQDREIPIHSGFEWYSYSNDNVTEAFSADGKHFAYATLSENGEGATLHIILDEKEINRVDGEEIKMRFHGDVLQYVVRNQDSSKEDDYYYEDDKRVEGVDSLVYSFTFQEFRYGKNGREDSTGCSTWIHIKSGRKACFGRSGLVSLDGVELERNINVAEGRDLYFSDFTMDNDFKNIAYRVALRPMWNKEWVSLNGSDSNLIFNDIINLHFSPDGKLIEYVGRRGAHVYKVKHEILIQ